MNKYFMGLLFLLLIIVVFIYIIPSSFRQTISSAGLKIQKIFSDFLNYESKDDLRQSVDQGKMQLLEKIKVRGKESIGEIQEEAPKIWSKISGLFEKGKEIIDDQ